MRLNDPTNSKIVRRSVLDSQYVTSCSVCHEGVYAWHETAWGRGIYLGICHKDCLLRVVAEAVLLA